MCECSRLLYKETKFYHLTQLGSRRIYLVSKLWCKECRCDRIKTKFVLSIHFWNKFKKFKEENNMIQ